MATSARQQIIAQLKTQLETITTGNGYNQTVKEVVVESPNPEEVTRTPAIFIYDNGAEANDQVNLGNIQVEVDLTVLFFVAGTSSPGVAAENMLADIIKALSFSGLGQVTISNFPVLVRYMGDDLFRAAPGERDEGGQLSYRIQYEHPIGDPFSFPGA